MNEHAAKLDQIDMEIAGLQRLQHRATVSRLEELGFDASGLRPVPFPHASESRGAMLARAVAHARPPNTANGQQLLHRHAVGRIIGVS